MATLTMLHHRETPLAGGHFKPIKPMRSLQHPASHYLNKPDPAQVLWFAPYAPGSRAHSTWSAWCIENEYRTSALHYSYRVTFDSRHILSVPNACTLSELGYADAHEIIDFDMLRRWYCGLEITAPRTSHTTYAWDVPSMVLWNTDAIIT